MFLSDMRHFSRDKFQNINDFSKLLKLFASHFSVRQLHVGQCLRGLCFSFLSSLKTGEMLEKIAYHIAFS